MLFLSAVVVLIYLCFYLYKKKLAKTSAENHRIKVVERKVLDQKTTVSLITIDDIEMVIVSHQNGVAIEPISKALAVPKPGTHLKKVEQIH